MSTFFGTTNVCGVIPLTDYSPRIEGVVLSGDSSAVTITLFSKDYSLTSSVVTLDLTFRDPNWTTNTPLQISVELIEATEVQNGKMPAKPERRMLTAQGYGQVAASECPSTEILLYRNDPLL